MNRKEAKRTADRWINKWWDEVHSPTATGLLTELLLRTYKKGVKDGQENSHTDRFLICGGRS